MWLHTSNFDHDFVWSPNANWDLVLVIPARYLYDDNGINITLQAAAQWIAESINRLSVDGVRLKDPTTGEEVTGFWIRSNCLVSVGLNFMSIAQATLQHIVKPRRAISMGMQSISKVTGNILWLCST